MDVRKQNNFSARLNICRVIACCLMIGCAIAVSLPAAETGAEVVDRIVAVVNDDIIRLSELNKRFEPVAEEIRSKDLSPKEAEEKLYEARSRILDDMINQILADQQIREAGIQVGDQEVDAAIERVKEMNYYTDKDIRQALQMQGMSMESYRRELRNQIRRSKLVNQKVKSSIVITEADVREYYENHKDEYAGKIRYQLRNIFMPYPEYGDTEKRRALREEMNAVYEKLKSGADFAEMARTHSDAPNATDGGELGRFALKDLSEKLRPVVKSLDTGEFSGVVETERGFQIFYLEDIIKTGGQSFEAVSAEIEKKLYDRAVDRKFESWIQSLREDAHIRIIR